MTIDFSGEALLLNLEEKRSEDALADLCVEGAQQRFTSTGVGYLSSKSLIPEVAFWNYWVKNIIFPTTHDRKIYVQR